MPPKNLPLSRLPLEPRRCLALALAAAALALAPGHLRAQPAPGAARWDHIKTALFFTDGDVKALLSKPEDRRATLAYFAPLRLSKVYLDNSSVDPAAVATLREIAADLRSHGLEVSGAVVPANRGPLCYNNPQDMALLEGRVKVLAKVFDEIIVDDWLFTNCTSPQSLAERGSQSWADYRSRLVSEQSKLHLIDAAKQVNPAARVIIKYPNWYEGHRQNGYDVALQTPQFDGVSVGIETRQPATQDQHIPTYSGYVFQAWIGGDAGPEVAQRMARQLRDDRGRLQRVRGRGVAGGPGAGAGDHLLVRGRAPPPRTRPRTSTRPSARRCRNSTGWRAC